MPAGEQGVALLGMHAPHQLGRRAAERLPLGVLHVVEHAQHEELAHVVQECGQEGGPGDVGPAQVARQRAGGDGASQGVSPEPREVLAEPRVSQPEALAVPDQEHQVCHLPCAQADDGVVDGEGLLQASVGGRVGQAQQRRRQRSIALDQPRDRLHVEVRLAVAAYGRSRLRSPGDWS